MRPPRSELAAARRLKAIDTLSTTGAGLAGIGLGALFPAPSQGAAIALLAVGLAAHLGGMTARHRRDADRPAAWWEMGLYWGCWALIGVLGAWLLWRWLG
ncbi:MAG TPA: hypothetical protein PKB04_01055 [Phenylobacterium sp.]|nr:hypothetical protein [Phenylobacterium sp.]